MASEPENGNLPATPTVAQFYIPERPEPSSRYLELARAAPCRLKYLKKLLIVSDLNGTSLARSFGCNTTTTTTTTTRPHVEDFLAYCQKHHCVATWSSARRKNVERVLTYLFTRCEISQLVAIWSRDDSRLGEPIDGKIQVYRQLRWLWDDAIVQASVCRTRDPENPGMEQSDSGSGTWDQTNTVLIDDSLEKADSEPYNLVRVEEFTGKAGNTQDDVLRVVLAYIEDLAWERDVSSAIHHKPFECARRQGWNWKIECPDFDNEQERNTVARGIHQESER